MMAPPQPFRKCISDNDHECLVYGADNLSQFTRSTAPVHSKCDRALPAARQGDILVLRGELDRGYHTWLRALGLGTDHVAAYGCSNQGPPLSRLIAENPAPVTAMVKELNKKPVYVPWFSGDMEKMAATALNADLFGAPAVETLRYNDKVTFKKICRHLGIRVVEDTVLKMTRDANQNRIRIKQGIEQYLTFHPSVLLRGSMDDTGKSLVFTTNGDDIDPLCRKLSALDMNRLIIEPLLEVRFSPNDQWIITRDKEIRHAGMLDQVLKERRHMGNLKIQAPFPVETEQIMATSLKIVRHMAASGYMGVLGIDYIVTDSRVYPVENNARFNGSSYVKIIINNIEELHGPVPCWKSIKVHTSPCTFNALSRQLAPVLFDGLKQASVFPYNCDSLEESGEFAVILMAASPGGIAFLEATLEELGVG